MYQKLCIESLDILESENLLFLQICTNRCFSSILNCIYDEY